MNCLRAFSGVFIVALMLTACGQQSAPTATPIEVEMNVHTEPEGLAVGNTTLVVTLKTTSGSPIDGATLQVHGDMDHEGMASVDREVSESTGGEYRVPFEWTMGGGWIVTVTAHLPRNGGEVSKTFDFFVEAVSSESVINQGGGAISPEATAESSAEMLSEPPEIEIAYQPESNPVKLGDGVVIITVTSGDNTPIADAAITVIGDMAHHGMRPIEGEGTYTDNGRYTVPLRWTMAGNWIVTVRATLPDGRQVEETFSQEVTSEQP